MKKILLVIGFIMITSLVFAVHGQTGRPEQAAATAAESVAAQKAIIAQYCVTCHSDKAKNACIVASRMINYDDLDLAHVEIDGETWERVVRKLRSVMMPPASARRPDPMTYMAFLTWLENELDCIAATYTPPPG